MRVFICTDMEGVSGVYSRLVWDVKSEMYRIGRAMLTSDVNAAVEGALEAGATRIVVNDGHGEPNNLLLEELNPNVEYECGVSAAKWLPGLDGSFDAVFAIGCHAMAGTEKAFLDHTQSGSWVNYFVNGVKMGEIGQTAVIAGHYGVPVVLVTGDLAATSEAKALLGDVETVAVKMAYDRNYARCIHPTKTRTLIKEAAKRALSRAKETPTYVAKTPITVKLEYISVDKFSESIPYGRGYERLELKTVTKDVESALDILLV
jgi:D-amino peptidase